MALIMAAVLTMTPIADTGEAMIPRDDQRLYAQIIEAEAHPSWSLEGYLLLAQTVRNQLSKYGDSYREVLTRGGNYTVYHNIAKHGLTAKPYRRFTQREELFIKDNYGKLAIVEIADTLNRSPKSVSQHVWVMKLKDMKEKSRRAVPVEVYYDIGWVERARQQMERLK